MTRFIRRAVAIGGVFGLVLAGCGDDDDDSASTADDAVEQSEDTSGGGDVVDVIA